MRLNDARRGNPPVEARVVVEIKSEERLLTTLRLLSLSVGLLITFAVPTLKDPPRQRASA